MDKAKLRSYAALIARMGVNVQPGQEVVIRTAPEQDSLKCWWRNATPRGREVFLEVAF